MGDMNQLILDTFRSRFACKDYDPAKAVSDEDFRTILEVARLSPTSFGFEPWKMIVLQNKELKRKLYPIAWGAQNSLNGASHLVILLTRKKTDTIYNSDYITHILTDIHGFSEEAAEARRLRYKTFQESDFNLLESERALFDWACKQTYIVLANMLTAAALLGVDSCPIEGFDQRAVDSLLADAGLFDPDKFGVSVMVSFGYRGEQPLKPKTRQPLSDLLIWNK